MQRRVDVRQPGDRAVAPGRLALVQDFVNSVNVEFGPDEFATAEGFHSWMEHNGFPRLQADPDELDRRTAVLLREGLRSLLRENNGAEPDPRARATVEHIARDCPVVAAFDGPAGRMEIRPAMNDVRGVMAAVLASVVQSVYDGTWERLKACREHRCEWAFYDRSRNRGSRWCSMAVCGTRSKMQTYRRAKQTRA
ncbi:CGNR zinc finger domain-containing protein [Streptomyces sp. NPDC085927]|uniref:CGNR zinc finger domain-containing protein n=1 Tax=Streptomyces sp. NPDC085927 TaxID=3365738 RepID=UPI0037D94B59